MTSVLFYNHSYSSTDRNTLVSNQESMAGAGDYYAHGDAERDDKGKMVLQV